MIADMVSRSEVLAEVMRSTRTTQAELARLSGVHQPSISQYLAGRAPLSDGKLDDLLSCMGYRLEVVRRPVQPALTRSERRSWLLHRRLARTLTAQSLEGWRPVVERNLERLEARVTGQPHVRNLASWRRLVDDGDVRALRGVLTGLDRDAIEMREVSPLGGLLSAGERSAVLAQAG